MKNQNYYLDYYVCKKIMFHTCLSVFDFLYKSFKQKKKKCHYIRKAFKKDFGHVSPCVCLPLLQ